MCFQHLGPEAWSDSGLIPLARWWVPLDSFTGGRRCLLLPLFFCSLQPLILAVWVYEFTGDCTLLYSNCTILISFLSCHHLIRIDSPSNYDSVTQWYSSHRKTRVNVWFFPLIYPLLKNWLHVIFQKWPVRCFFFFIVYCYNHGIKCIWWVAVHWNFNFYQDSDRPIFHQWDLFLVGSLVFLTWPW